MRHMGSILALSIIFLSLCGPTLRAAPCSNTYSLQHFLIIAEGDSITFGQGASDGRSFVQRACLEDTVFDQARSRATLGSAGDKPGDNSLYGRLDNDAQLIFEKKADQSVILTILIGRNDLVGYNGGAARYAEDLANYIAAVRSAGADRVVVCTLLPSFWAPFTKARGALNAILRQPSWAKSHGIDAIADFAASPIMGTDAAASDKALFIDGIHPTDHGYDILAPIYREAIKTAMR